MKNHIFRRTLTAALAFVLVLGCMPAVALAEEAEPQAHKCEHCDQEPEWIAWDGTTSMEDGKHYQLTAEELKLSAPIALSEGSYVLCQGIGEDNNCLKRFDEVIINGGDLEDGQKIK